MNRKAATWTMLATFNEYLPLWGVCVPGPCPALPTPEEIVFWHLVTALCMLCVFWNLWADHRNWPESHRYRAGQAQGPEPPRFG